MFDTLPSEALCTSEYSAAVATALETGFQLPIRAVPSVALAMEGRYAHSAGGKTPESHSYTTRALITEPR